MSTQTFPFPSRSSNATHTVTVGANGHLVCTCPGFRSPSKCWHVREVAEKLGLPNTAMSTTPPLPWGDSPTGRLTRNEPALQALPGTPAHQVERALAGMPPDMFIEPMLGKALKEGDTIENYVNNMFMTLEFKYDGHRVILHKDANGIVLFWSRDHNLMTSRVGRHIIAACQMLAPGTYDGELFIPGLSSTDAPRKDMYHKQKLVLFDILRVYAPEDVGRADAGGWRSTLHLPLRDRRSLLQMAMSKVPNNDWTSRHADVFQAPSFAVKKEILDNAWDRGEEGVMLKDVRAPYEPGRRVWLKFKKEETGRMTVTGYKEGKMGPHAVVCGVDVHGIKVQCKARDTAMRTAFDKDPDVFIGKTLVFSYQQKTRDGRYRHPRADHFEN
jgi:hypothetical protein